MTNHSRDFRLDAYRALMMIYIPCVIHVMFFLQKGNAFWQSVLLFEMPVIFFIAGASMFVAYKERSFLSTLRNRASRILLPHYIYLLICYALLFTASIFFSLPNLKITPEHIINGLLIQDRSLPIPYTNHIWFIIPYFIVACSFPIQKKWADKTNRWVYMSIILILCFLSPLLSESNNRFLSLLRQPLIYNFFYIAGYLFFRQTSLKSIICIMIPALIITITFASIEFSQTGTFNMQSHKFPPDFLFLSFGVSIICLLSIIFRNITIPKSTILDFWNKSGFTIYLWQNIAFWVYTIAFSSICNHLNINPDNIHPLLDFIIASISIFILSTLTALIITPLERKIITLLKSTSRK